MHVELREKKYEIKEKNYFNKKLTVSLNNDLLIIIKVYQYKLCSLLYKELYRTGSSKIKNYGNAHGSLMSTTGPTKEFYLNWYNNLNT